MSNPSERIVLNIPVNFTAEELAKYCKINPGSSAFEAVEEALELVNRYAEPKAIIRWVNVDGIIGDKTTIEGVTFTSKVVAEKLQNTPRVFMSVITAGEGLEKCEDFEDDPFLDMFNAALIYYASAYVVQYLKEKFGYDGSSFLNPGSLPDWPIDNNFSLFDIIGNVDEIGVTLTDKGYIKPWNSVSHIHFSGDGYQNCSLCRNYDCIGRRAAFDRSEYIRIFGVEP